MQILAAGANLALVIMARPISAGNLPGILNGCRPTIEEKENQGTADVPQPGPLA
jgi:hypothetical protein